MKEKAINHGFTTVFETPATENHFFGYYDKSPFNADGNLLIGHETALDSTRLPLPEDKAYINLWDITTGQKTRLAQTNTFNFQQGAMLAWLGPDFNSRVIYNDFRENRYVSVILDIHTKEEKILPFPVYYLSPDGKFALCVNYDHLYWCRPGYNYQYETDRKWSAKIPEGDGIFKLDLESGTTRLLVSTREIAALNPKKNGKGQYHYLEHICLSPDGDKFFFLHRWLLQDGGIYTRPYVIDIDGSNPRLICDSGEVSHYTWRDNNSMLLYGNTKTNTVTALRNNPLISFLLPLLRPIAKRIFKPESKMEKSLLNLSYFLWDEQTSELSLIDPKGFPTDGHPTFFPGNPGKFLSDTYPRSDSYRELYVYDMEKKEKQLLGEFFSPEEVFQKPWGCDLHPRFDRQGRKICIDSLHSGKRQMLVIVF